MFVARKDARQGDDIDTLIVLRSIDEERVSRFKDWVFQIHEEVDMTVDPSFPYELFTLEIHLMKEFQDIGQDFPNSLNPLSFEGRNTLI